MHGLENNKGSDDFEEVNINFEQGATTDQTDLTPTKLPLKEFIALLFVKLESPLTHVFKVALKLFHNLKKQQDLNK